LEEEIFLFFDLPVVFLGDCIGSQVFLTETSPDIENTTQCFNYINENICITIGENYTVSVSSIKLVPSPYAKTRFLGFVACY
jgi:hypothetical protein